MKQSPFSLQGKTSFPYLSGFTWAHFCKWRMLNRDLQNGLVRFDLRMVRDGDTIMIDYGCLEDFSRRILPQLDARVILVTSNYGFYSDFPLPGPFYFLLESPKIIAWFVQNIDREASEKLIPIPIGIANRNWEHGNTDLLDRYIPLALEKTAKSIFCYLNHFVHPQRVECSVHFRSIGIQRFPRTTFAEYLQHLSESVFVVSPPGQGVDCHRTWEALLMGCYPIVIRSKLNPLYEDLPIVAVDHWNEVTVPFLERKYTELQSRTWSRSKLYAPYWFDRVNALQVRVCSETVA